MDDTTRLIVSTLASSTILIGTITFLIRKLLIHKLNGDIEKLKIYLNYDTKLKIEQRIAYFKIEHQSIQSLWKLIRKLTMYYSGREPVEIKKLDIHHDNLEIEYMDLAPFIDSSLSGKIKELLTISDPADYDGKNYNKILEIELEISKLIKENWR